MPFLAVACLKNGTPLCSVPDYKGATVKNGTPLCSVPDYKQTESLPFLDREMQMKRRAARSAIGHVNPAAMGVENLFGVG